NACADHATLAATLYSRMCHLDDLAPLTARLAGTIPRPYITARHHLPDLSVPALRRVLTNHTAPVRSCTVSGDGQTIVSISDDGRVRVWDAISGVLRSTLQGHSAAVNACAVSGDGQTIVSVSDDGTVRVWDAISGVLRSTLQGHSAAVNA